MLPEGARFDRAAQVFGHAADGSHGVTAMVADECQRGGTAQGRRCVGPDDAEQPLARRRGLQVGKPFDGGEPDGAVLVVIVGGGGEWIEELPLAEHAAEAQQGAAHLRARPGGQGEPEQAGMIALERELALAHGGGQRGGDVRSGGRLEAAVEKLIVNGGDHCRIVGAQRQAEPWAGAIGGQRLGHQAPDRVDAALGRKVGQGEVQGGFAAIERQPPVHQRGQPDVAAIPEIQPKRVVEKPVGRLIKRAQGEVHGLVAVDPGEQPDRFDADPRVRVGDGGGKQFERGLAAGLREPIAQHADGGGADFRGFVGDDPLEQGEVRRVVALGDPERGEALAAAGIRRRERLAEIGRGPALVENRGRLLALVAVAADEQRHQLGAGERGEIADRGNRRAAAADPPDPAVLAVAAGITEIDFTVVDDRVRPVGNVEGAVRADFHIDRPEVDVVGAHQIVRLLGAEAGSFIGDGEPDDALGAEVAGDHAALPIIREMRRLDDFQAAELRVAAGADAAEDALGAGVGEIHCAGDTPVDAGTAGTVGDERLAVAVELVAPRVAPAVEDGLDPFRAGVEAHDAAAAQAQQAVRRLGVGAGVDALVHPDAAVRAAPQRVQVVVGVLGAEPAEHAAHVVGLAVAGGVGEVEQIGALADVATAVAGENAGGNEQALGKDGGGIGLTVAGGVAENDDFVVGGLADFDLRVNLRAGDPQVAVGVEVHLGRLVEQRVFRPQGDFIAVGHREPRVRLGRLGGEGGLGAGRRLGLGGGRRVERAERRDAGVGFGDELVEAVDFPGVAALFGFAEAEDVGHVGGSRAVEEPVVFTQDGRAQGLGRGAFVPRDGAPAEAALDFAGRRLVAAAVEVDAVVAQAGQAREAVERDERDLPCGGDVAQRAVDFGQGGAVVADGGGVVRFPRAEKPRRRPEDEKPGRAVAAGRRVQQAFEVAAEFSSRLPAGERGGHAVAGHQHARAIGCQLGFQLAPAFVLRLAAGLQRAEPGPRRPGRGVGTPAEVAEGDRAVGEAGGGGQLDPAFVLLALDEGVADQGDAVAVLEFEDGFGCEGVGDGEQGRNQESEDHDSLIMPASVRGTSTAVTPTKECGRLAHKRSERIARRSDLKRRSRPRCSGTAGAAGEWEANDPVRARRNGLSGPPFSTHSPVPLSGGTLTILHKIESVCRNMR